MPLTHVIASLPARRSPEAVWSAFSDVPAWREWDWMGMADAAWVSGPPWTVGSVIRVGHQPFVFDCTIADCEPPRRVTWVGRGARVDARHTYRFERHPRGCLIVSEETFSGPLARALLPLVRWYWHRHLHGLRRRAEAEPGEVRGKDGGPSRGAARSCERARERWSRRPRASP